MNLTLKKTPVLLLCAVLYTLGLVPIIRFTFPRVNTAIEQGWNREAVTNAHTAFPYPVVMLSDDSGNPFIIYYENIERNETDLKSNTYLLPTTKRAGRDIALPYAEARDSDISPPIGRYEMKPLKNGNQAFHVVVTRMSKDRGLYTFVSWYEATPTGIMPRYYNWNRDWNTFANILIPVIVVYTGLWFIISLISRRTEKRRSSINAS